MFKTNSRNIHQMWADSYQGNISTTLAIKKTLKSFEKLIGGRYFNFQVNGTYYNQPVKLTYQLSDVKTAVYELNINPIINSDHSLFTSYKPVILGDKSLDKYNKIFTHKEMNIIGHFDKELRSEMLSVINNIEKIIIINSSTIFEITDISMLADENYLKKLFSISDKIFNPGSIYEKILNNILHDTNEMVREENLKIFLDYKNYSDYLDKLEKLQNDYNINISLMILTKLNKLNNSMLLNILNNINNSITKIRYIKWLNNFIENKEVFEYAHKLIPFIDSSQITEYIILLIKEYNEFSIPYLIEIIKNDSDELEDHKLQIEIIKYFTYIKSKDANEWIESKLFYHNEEVKIQAIKAMKKIGTINSVEKLQKLTSKKYSEKVRYETLDAISLIQSGIPDETKGALMMAEDELQGELSLEDETGQLSNIEKNDQI